jgi:hypothetical protein
MAASDEWDTLVQASRVAHDALIRFPLFERGMMAIDRLPEFEKLQKADRIAREQMDKFLSKQGYSK